jgi:hypothetical protein
MQMTKLMHAISVLCVGAGTAMAGDAMAEQALSTEYKNSVRTASVVQIGPISPDASMHKSLSSMGNSREQASQASLVPAVAAAVTAVPAEESSAVDLGLMLSSWGVVALIAMRRLLG